jgi:hypothetical protein
MWSKALNGSENVTLGEVNQKYLERFELWCWRRTEKVNWSDSPKNEEAILRVTEKKIILHKVNCRKVN